MGRAISLIVFGTLAVILMTVAFSTVSEQSGVQFSGIEVVAASEGAPVADYVVIGGKLSDAVTGEWLNNYAIIPYEDHIEVTNPQTRFSTRTGEHAFSGEGVTDGFFLIRIPNRYKLTTDNAFLNANGDPVEMRYIDNGVMASNELFIWLSDVHPGQIFCLDVPDKQLEFAIAAMPVDNAHLPDDIRQNKTVLLENGRIQAQTPTAADGTVVSFPIEALQLTNPEIVSIMWTRQFFPPANMNARQVYDQYVAPATPEISYEQFVDQVMTYNATLSANQTFYQGEKYYLPLPSSP